jgi:hypothetical protein
MRRLKEIEKKRNTKRSGIKLTKELSLYVDT